MNPSPNLYPYQRPDPVPRLLSFAALLVALVALVFSMTGLAPAMKGHGSRGGELVRLDSKGKIPAKLLPTVPSARSAKKLNGASRSALSASCPVSNAINLGSWCLESTTFRVPPEEAGKNDYFYAAQKCVKEGGWLPTAAQLIGAAPKAALKSTIDDDPGTSGTSETPEAASGIKDEREMTSDLFTTAAGSRAAGSEGVTAGSKGVGNLGEPDPVPVPAEPAPETLDYVTVYDNHNLGGFAGGEAVGKAENFRCAYAKGYQGKPRNTSSRS